MLEKDDKILRNKFIICSVNANDAVVLKRKIAKKIFALWSLINEDYGLLNFTVSLNIKFYVNVFVFHTLCE